MRTASGGSDVSIMLGRQLLLLAGVVLIGGAVLSFIFRGPGDVAAVWTSAAVAVAVQLAAFSLGRVVGKGGGLSARMGLGALIRFFGLLVYALLVIFVFRMPATAALISLAAFFFLSSVIEPLLIK